MATMTFLVKKGPATEIKGDLVGVFVTDNTDQLITLVSLKAVVSECSFLELPPPIAMELVGRQRSNGRLYISNSFLPESISAMSGEWCDADSLVRRYRACEQS